MDGRKRLSLKKKQGNDWLDEVAGPSKRKDNDIMIIDPPDKLSLVKESKIRNNFQPQEGNSNGSHSTQSLESQASKLERKEPKQNYERLMHAMMSESLSKTGGYKPLPSSKRTIPKSAAGYKPLPRSCFRCTLIRSQPLITYDSANDLFRNQRETANDTGQIDLQRDNFPSEKERELNMSNIHALPSETTKDCANSMERMNLVSIGNTSKKSQVVNFENGMKYTRKENEKSRNNLSPNQESGQCFVGKCLDGASSTKLTNLRNNRIRDKSKFDSWQQSCRGDKVSSSSRQSENEMYNTNHLEEDFDFDLGLDDLLLDLPETSFLKTSSRGSSASKPTKPAEKVEEGFQSSSVNCCDPKNYNEMSNNLQTEKGKGDEYAKPEFVSRKRPQQFDKDRTKDRNHHENFAVDGVHGKRNSGYSGLINNERSRYIPIDISKPKKLTSPATPGPQSPSIYEERFTDKRRENVKVNRIHLGHVNSASVNGHLSQQNRNRVPMEASVTKTASQKERKIKKSQPNIQNYFKGSKSDKNNMKSNSAATKNPQLSSTSRSDQNNGEASCPICQMKFPRGWREFKRNSHASRCMADEIVIDDDEDELFIQMDLT